MKKDSRHKDTRLIIGRIPYANLYPIFYYLEHRCNSTSYEFINGAPSEVNRMLRKGELDVSPSSSIEFLRNKGRYYILPWFSISSTGCIKSILLFSKLPIQELGGCTIALSSESETSTVLLKIILKEFHSLKCKFRSVTPAGTRNILSSFPAVLHIGDTAMKEAKRIEQSAAVRKSAPPPLYIYDLGELWHEHTGLPFVFALWVANKKALKEKGDLVKLLTSDLFRAKRYAGRKFPVIAQDAPQKKWLSEKELVDYWKIISYDLSERHLEGLRLFEKYSRKI